MPRQVRRKSESGIYHIMLRGINQQQIFEDSEDYEKFLQILKDCKAVSEYKLFAYCLMGNHIHLLIQEDKEPIEQVIKRLATRFVYWYNIKYQRVGHLFQDRFKSEPVEDDAYFMTVIRYIHQNPVKAGLCKNVREYEYSSYKNFFDNSNLIDKNFVLVIIPIELFARHRTVPCLIVPCLILGTYMSARQNGDKNVYFIDGYSLFPDIARHDCTVDGCHPNDLGMYFMAERIVGVLANVIKGE